MRHVDLCSGIGGFALGFEWAGLSTPVLFCDIEPWCRSVLRKHWPHVPIHSDVKELANDPERFIPDCDILTAGYPCQPFSSAGKRQGEQDDRHIWPYILQIVAHKRPTWTVFENVYGHVSLGLDTVLADLEAEGYTTRTFIVPACGVGAPHRRDRLWIVGYTEHNGPSTSTLQGEHGENERGSQEGQKTSQQFAGTSKPRIREDVGNAKDNGCDGGSEGVGREGTESQQDESQLEIWSQLSGPSADVADTSSAGSKARSAHRVGDDDDSRRDSKESTGAGSKRGGADVADPESVGVQGLRSSGEQESHTYAQQEVSVRSSEDVADTVSQRAQGGTAGRQDAENARESSRGAPEWDWDVEPDVGRVANGVPKRVDRLRGLGNAIVPQIAQQIGTAIRMTHV